MDRAAIEVDIMKKKQTKKFDITLISIIAVILVAYSIVMIALLAWGLLTSLKSNMDFSTLGNVLGWPDKHLSDNELKFNNYKVIWENFEFDKSVSFYSGDTLVRHFTKNNFIGILSNTLLYSIVGSMIQAFVPAVMGYLVVKYPGKVSSFIIAMMLFVMTMPIIGNSSTTLRLLRTLNLYDNFIGNFIQKFSFTGMYFFVFQAFFRSVSDSYAEAAEIDGASQLRVMFGIYIPLAWKMISTVVLILFVNCWNDYQTPLLYLPTHPTLAYAVYYLAYENNQVQMSTLPIKVSACMMLALPILVVFIFLKDKIMGNVSLGGVKE